MRGRGGEPAGASVKQTGVGLDQQARCEHGFQQAFGPRQACYGVDRLDLRILQTMGLVLWGREPIGFDALSTSYIAEQGGVTPETVRKRREMEEQDIIEGYQV